MEYKTAWPVLTRYEGEHLARIGLPLGGVGTGTISLGGRGNLFDWEITNRPAKGSNGGRALFLLIAGPEGQDPIGRALEGVLLPPYDGAHGLETAWHGFPRFRECRFAAAYPLGQVLLSDPDVPVEVRLEAWNPLVPADPDASGIPAAVLRYVLRNRTGAPMRATVCGTLHNYVAQIGSSAAIGEALTQREADGLHGLVLSPVGRDAGDPEYGDIALSTTCPRVTVKRGWPDRRLNDAQLHVWDDLLADGRLDPAEDPQHPYGSLAAEVDLPPDGEAEILFLITWRFPNRETWTPTAASTACAGDCCDEGVSRRVGNYYATRYGDAWDVARRVAEQLPELEERTVRFVRAVTDSDLPPVVQEAALSNLSTLRSETCFRTEDGRFYGWEGCSDAQGCCHGSCTHVWNYEQATAHLFGAFARSMREVEFLHATDERGRMAFRVNLPLEHAPEYPYAAADGQMGCVMKAYRDWQLSGDDAFLRRLWPGVRRALAFAWVPGGWDADRDGVMEGCQHHTLDVEYFGPNPLTGLWYLGALRAAEEMARHLGEEDFADTCRMLFSRGSAWIDAHLFNGEYYEQDVRPPGRGATIADGLRSNMGADDLDDPDFQLGAGCLVDQTVGQYMAHVCGLGYLVDRGHLRAALESVLRYNHRDDLYGHMNYMRTFALNDERALLMCTWPHGGRPRTPVRFSSEVMTGFEYSAAVHMLYEGMIDEGLLCIGDIRARYDGRRRSPFDEAECGHHYARAMASWGAVLALTGFRYSGVTRSMTFAARPGRHFWSSGDAWGTCVVREEGGAMTVHLTVLHGALRLRRLILTGLGSVDLTDEARLAEGDTVAVLLAEGAPGYHPAGAAHGGNGP